jgi:hypothetical protein
MTTTLADLKIMSYRLLWIEHMEVRLECMEQTEGPDLWAIRKGGSVCLDKEGDWVFESMPSNRDKKFFASCRFASPEEALALWESGPKQKLIDYYEAMKQRSQA